MKKIITGIALTAVFVALVSPVHAVTEPTFASCLNPQGEVTAKYADGVHGIVGQPDGVRGEDTVYKNGSQDFVQCFCPPDGAGIQTNWMNAANLSEDERKSFIYAGWNFVADGSAWGLTADPYLAKNMSYSCRGNGTTTGTTQSATASVSNSSGSSSGSSSSNSNPSSIGQILGLAYTGNVIYMYALAVIGAASLIAGVVWEKQLKRSRKS